MAKKHIIPLSNVASSHVVLTGDRPTGPLHLGHLVGSLMSRLALQDMGVPMYILVADMQALTDNAGTPQKVRDHIAEVMLDYLAVGLDPNKVTFVQQSKVCEIAQIFQYLLNFVTVNRIGRVPTVKAEIKQRGFKEDSVPLGFYSYAVSQAADIVAFGGDVVPVGEDQLAIIEVAREIVQTFSSLYKTEMLKMPQAMLSSTPRLPGIDGKEKMSKSSGNVINIADAADTVARTVKKMFTDDTHLKKDDAGDTVSNPVFAYLRAFDPDQAGLAEMEAAYRTQGVVMGDMEVKQRLITVLNDLLEPMRKRRDQFSAEDALAILRDGTMRGRTVVRGTLARIEEAIGIA